MDRSTTQRLSEVREPGDVACEADEGSMICTELCPLMATVLELEKDGLRMAAVPGFRESCSPSLLAPLAAPAFLFELGCGLGARFGVGATDESTDEGSDR